MARPTFKGHVDNIQIKTRRTAEDFWKLANKNGFVKRGRQPTTLLSTSSASISSSELGLF